MILKDVIREMKELYKDEYDIITNDINLNIIKDKTKLTIKHNTCNSTFEKTYRHFIDRKQTCPKCSDYKLTYEKVKERIEDSGEYKLLSTEYKNVKSKIIVKHLECGNIYEVFPRKFFEGNRCPVCSKSTGPKFKNNNTFVEEVKKLVKDEYIFLEEYTTSKTKLLCRHNICNHEWYIKPNDFLSNNIRCPRCWHLERRSYKEKEVEEYIRSIYSGKICSSYKLNGMEIDIYIPDKKIGIEYNGSYWHSEANGCNKSYHLNKTNKCKENGITLIHIFEDEWLEKRNIVESKLRHLLYLNDNGKIYARKCTIKEIENSKVRNTFLLNNHIQGGDRSSLSIGLYYDEMLVSVMTFCNLRKSLGRSSKEGTYELSRFATDINYQVIGAFGKLWNYFIKNYEFNEIITYADKRWSVGNMYIVNGFNYLYDSEPNYWYIKNSKRFHRFNYRKQNLKNLFPEIYDDNKTEKTMMIEMKYHIIWDCGNMVFSYKNE